jgi:hypothetical protein
VNTSRARSPIKRVAYSFIGLLGGEAALLLYLLLNAFRLRAYLLAMHMGEPARQIPLALEIFVVYATFSFAGWLLVGVPTALFFRAHSITRLPWTLRVVVGAALGPLALFVIFVLLSHGHLELRSTFRSTGMLWVYSILVSSVSFVLYVALLGKKSSLSMPDDPRVGGRNGADTA